MFQNKSKQLSKGSDDRLLKKKKPKLSLKDSSKSYSSKNEKIKTDNKASRNDKVKQRKPKKPKLGKKMDEDDDDDSDDEEEESCSSNPCRRPSGINCPLKKIQSQLKLIKKSYLITMIMLSR